jgi:hypothetical protein
MGFKTAVLSDVRVNASTPATVKVALSVGGLEETVVVTGGAEIIQTTSAAVTSTIDTNQILKIPTGSLSNGLQFQTSYVYGKQDGTARYSLRYPRERVQDTGTVGGVAHAFRANWVYELPFGQGRRFGSSAGPLLNQLIGGWSFDGIARIQSGTTLDFGNVRVVGMTTKELQDNFTLRSTMPGSWYTCCRRTSLTTLCGRAA